jgi:hypothetical protein
MDQKEPDWATIRAGAFSTARPSDWPENVTALSWNGHSLFGMDRKTRELYWDGDKVVIERKVSLEGWTLALAAIATVAGVVAAVWPIAVHFGLVGKAFGSP